MAQPTATQAHAQAEQSGAETYICTPDQLPGILAAHSNTDRRAFVDERSAVDPRNTGLSGGYPSLRAKRPYDIPRLLYKRVGLYRRIVDMPADDVWSKGWTLVTSNDTVRDRALEVDQRARIRRAFKRSTKMARRDGWALVVYKLTDNTGDSEQVPRGVRRVDRAVPLPRDAVKEIIFSEETGEPEFWVIKKRAFNRKRDPNTPQQGAPREDGSVTYHHSRVEFVCQHEKESDSCDGDSVLSWSIGDAQGLENIKWAAAESYYRYAAPLLVAQVDKDTRFDPDKDGKTLEKHLDKLQNNLTQKAWFKGTEIRAVNDSMRINTPDPYADLFMDSLAGGHSIPKRELTGSEAGALASASWDEKRYFARIQNDQDEFATPLLLNWYRKLDEWGLVPGLDSALMRIDWPPHLELDDEQKMKAILQFGTSLQHYARVGLPVPKEAAALLTFPESVDLDQPLELVEVPGPGRGAPPAGNESTEPGKQAKATAEQRSPRSNLEIQVDAELRRIEDRLSKQIMRAFRAWRNLADDELEKIPGANKQNVLHRLFKKNRVEDDAVRVISGLKFPHEDLAGSILRLLEEAGTLGMTKTWGDLGASGELRDFIESTEHDSLVAFSKRWAEDKAEAATVELRDAVSDAMADGESLHGIRKKIRDRFDARIENEAMVARTESMRGYNEGAGAAMREAGIKRWEFQAYPGRCEFCDPLDEKTFLLEDKEFYPPEGTHPNCRCTPLPVIE